MHKTNVPVPTEKIEKIYWHQAKHFLGCPMCGVLRNGVVSGLLNGT